MKVLEFQAPRTKEEIPTTIVLVVDHSGSMEQENRIGALKEAVASFLEKLPEGSRVAVVAFSSEVESGSVRSRPIASAVREGRQPAASRRGRRGSTTPWPRRSSMLDEETGRRALLALTDGEDTVERVGQSRHRHRRGPAAGAAGLHPGPGHRGGDRQRRPPAAGHLEPRPVLSRPQRRAAPGDLRDHRRAHRRELQPGLRERPPPARRHPSPGADLPPGQPARPARPPSSSPAWSSPPAAGRRCFSCSSPHSSRWRLLQHGFGGAKPLRVA